MDGIVIVCGDGYLPAVSVRQKQIEPMTTHHDHIGSLSVVLMFQAGVVSKEKTA